MIFWTDAQVFDHRNPKESYIAVIGERYGAGERASMEEGLIAFLAIGYEQAHDAEGFAILQALRYIEKQQLFFSMIYTDSLSWSKLINTTKIVRGTKDRHIHTRKIAEEILRLKTTYHVSISWKSRKVNKAGHFLAKIWSHKKEYREALEMEVSEWKNL